MSEDQGAKGLGCLQVVGSGGLVILLLFLVLLSLVATDIVEAEDASWRDMSATPSFQLEPWVQEVTKW